MDYPNKIILNKGLPIINDPCNNTRVLNLPNIDREGETYPVPDETVVDLS